MADFITLREFMTAANAPIENYSGLITNDDNVLAVSVNGATDIGSFAVVDGYIAGIDAQLNPVAVDKQYIRKGMNSTKTGQMRSFKITGDRYVGDAFQDFALDSKIVHGVGDDVIVRYAWFCMLTGIGEKGEASVIVNSDGTGVAGEMCAFDVDLKITGGKPESFNYKTDVTAS